MTLGEPVPCRLTTRRRDVTILANVDDLRRTVRSSLDAAGYPLLHLWIKFWANGGSAGTTSWTPSSMISMRCRTITRTCCAQSSKNYTRCDDALGDMAGFMSASSPYNRVTHGGSRSYFYSRWLSADKRDYDKLAFLFLRRRDVRQHRCQCDGF